MIIPFTKMHGLGNDFIVINGIANPLPDPARFAKMYCDRHFGIGADQLLIVESSAEAQFKMRIFNADGSEVEMCGNGIRCLARFILEQGLSPDKKLSVETMAGVMYPQIHDELVTVNMGKPRLVPADIPVSMDGESVINRKVEFLDTVLGITMVSMGNPHCIVFLDNPDQYDITVFGPVIERSSLFPNRTNVEFVTVIDDKTIDVKVWERGCGLTLACGTGACASAVASCLNNKTQRSVTVILPGGKLFIEWGDDDTVFMTGPAEKVFDGTVII